MDQLETRFWLEMLTEEFSEQSRPEGYPTAQGGSSNGRRVVYEDFDDLLARGGE